MEGIRAVGRVTEAERTGWWGTSGEVHIRDRIGGGTAHRMRRVWERRAKEGEGEKPSKEEDRNMGKEDEASPSERQEKKKMRRRIGGKGAMKIIWFIGSVRHPYHHNLNDGILYHRHKPPTIPLKRNPLAAHPRHTRSSRERSPSSTKLTSRSRSSEPPRNQTDHRNSSRRHA